jgi:hypothetical protein
VAPGQLHGGESAPALIGATHELGTLGAVPHTEELVKRRAGAAWRRPGEEEALRYLAVVETLDYEFQLSRCRAERMSRLAGDSPSASKNSINPLEQL